MFWGDSANDVKITIFLIFISLIVSIFLFYKARKILLSILTFSALSNFVVYLAISVRSSMFFDYDFPWLIVFAKKPWPLINLVLLVIAIGLYLKKKRIKK